MSHPFGNLLSQYRARKHGLSQTRLAQLAGYDPAVLVRMCQGKKDLTGPSGRDRVLRIIDALHDEGVLKTQAEANALLEAAAMPPLYASQPAEAAVLVKLDGKLAESKPAVTHQRSNLPHPLTPLLGRDEDIAQVKALLTNDIVRVVTLIGPPGVGKTRLALRVASEMEAHSGEVFFVPLAPVGEMAFVLPTIAQSMRVIQAHQQSLMESVKTAIHNRCMLLVIDNFEHVTEAAPQIAELIAASPLLKVLTTSRTALHISGEHEYVVQPLANQPATDLLIQRAQAVNAHISSTEGNARVLTAICNRLDHLPLAIELAAARLKLFTPEALIERLAKMPLDMLTNGASDLPMRQHTLRSTIDWSYGLLNVNEQVVFRKLGVFAGGFTLASADAVTGVDWETLSSLLDKSLIIDVGKVNGELRFTMLELLREYALERLTDSGEMKKIQGQHAEYYLELAEQAEPQLSGARKAEWLNRLDTERDNMRTALAWCLESDVMMGLRLAGALTYFLIERWPTSESRSWLVAILAHTGRQQESAELRVRRAKILRILGHVVEDSGRIDEADAYYQESLMLYQSLGDKHGIATVTHRLGELGWASQDPTRRTHFEESLALFRELGDQDGIANDLNGLGGLAWSQGDFARATTLWEECLNLYEGLGDQGCIASMLTSLGIIALYQGEYTRATTLLEDGLALARKVEDKARIFALINLGYVELAQNACSRAKTLLEESLSMAREFEYVTEIAWSLHGLATAVWLEGDHVRATALYGESLLHYQGKGDRWGIANCLDGFAWVACSLRHQEQDTTSTKDVQNAMRCLRLLGAVEALREITGNPRSVAEIVWIERAIADARFALEEVAFTAAWAEGRAMTLEQAIEYALEVALMKPRNQKAGIADLLDATGRY